jgi:hypothetical protein
MGIALLALTGAVTYRRPRGSRWRRLINKLLNRG